jgi:hypothetical protein
MTIYVIRSASFGDIVEATTHESSADIWRRDDTWTIEEQPDATDDETVALEALDAWLIDNYDNGAHWVYETTDRARHVVGLREAQGDIAAYRATLRAQWELVGDYADDIRNA